MMIAAIPLISSALSLLGPSQSTPTTAASPTGGADFGSVMNKVSNDALDSIKHAEKLATDGIQGKADTQSVVQAVMSAQENLQTALAIRDKTVAAFQEITRMSI